jgi:hypothetical protein
VRLAAPVIKPFAKMLCVKCFRHASENFKVMDATKSMDRKEEGKEEEKGRKEGRKGGKGERKVLGGVWDGHVCLTLSDDG